MNRHMLLALTLLPFAACSAGLADGGLTMPSVAVYGQPQATALWKGEREKTETGCWVDPYGLAQPRNVPSWRSIPLPQGSAAVLFEPGRTLAPVAVVVEGSVDVPLTVVVFLEACSAADLSSPACWSKWGETPWLVGM